MTIKLLESLNVGPKCKTQEDYIKLRTQLYLLDSKRNRKLTRLGIITRLNRQTEHTAGYDGMTRHQAGDRTKIHSGAIRNGRQKGNITGTT